jgi:hypothetical protein
MMCFFGKKKVQWTSQMGLDIIEVSRAITQLAAE